MANLFEGLEGLGFSSLPEVELYEKKKVNNAQDSKEQAQKSEAELAESLIFDRSCDCPVCGRSFMQRTVIKSKLKVVSSDFDLRTIYSPVDPLMYDVHLCDKCGYAAPSMFFKQIIDAKATLVKQMVTPKFTKKEYPKMYSLDDAIERHKLALFNSFAKKARNSEKAYICIKIGWLYRSKGDDANEKLFLSTAKEGLVSAYENETMPVCGFSEHVIQYLIACYEKIDGNYNEAARWLSVLLRDKSLSKTLAEKAENLKYEIQELNRANHA